MKKLAILFITAINLIYFAPCCAIYCLDYCVDVDSDVAFGVGWRRDDIKYAFSNPAIPSTVTAEWSNLNSFILYGRGESYFNDAFYLRFEGDWGWVGGGKQQISINGPIDVTFLESARGHVYDLAVAVGYWYCFRDRYSITPLVGYSYSVQRLHNDITIVTTEVDKYHLQWQKPWFGVNFAYAWNNWNLFLEYQYHFSSFRGFVKQFTIPEKWKLDNSHGNEVYLGTTYLTGCLPCLRRPLKLGLMGIYKSYWGNNGKIIPDVPGDILDLSYIRWHSGSLIFDITYEF